MREVNLMLNKSFKRDGTSLSNKENLKEAYVYIANVPKDSFKKNHYYSEILSNCEQERARSFKFTEDRKAYITAHLLLRSALSLHFPISPKDWVFESSLSGKPEQVNFPGKVQFNISHTRGMVCCVLSLYDSGIDVENMDSLRKINFSGSLFDIREVFSSTFLPMRDKYLNAAICWTLQESSIKATGEGLDGIERKIFLSDLKGWKFSTLLVENRYVISVSVQEMVHLIRVICVNFNGSTQLIGLSKNIETILN